MDGSVQDLLAKPSTCSCTAVVTKLQKLQLKTAFQLWLVLAQTSTMCGLQQQQLQRGFNVEANVGVSFYIGRSIQQ